ncbi:choice-of-anchor J domain-containing protein [Vallitalea sp.]|uniref:choice-of-anchor J domain-containing protein n=1 Tax=Vallitalea sp. TaxID=1882829 RepID=UPI0025D7C4B2|nr:choice-of-anchor J domain-containing protein [Vallitalea sp.]MCT4688469.1 immune inhibitor A [Vallitalea sp.]
MKKKALTVLLALVFCLTFAFNVPEVYAEDGWDTSRYGDLIDIGPKLRELEKDNEYKQKVSNQIKEFARTVNLEETRLFALESDNPNFTFNGGTKHFLSYDSKNGYYLKTYTLRSIGTNVEIWIADNLDYIDDREAPVITQAQADHMKDVFDKTVYPKDTDFFGMHDSHTGINATLPSKAGLSADYYVSKDGVERVILLVDNFKDKNYYNKDYPLIIGGFYSPMYEEYIDRNIINISAKDWDKRLDKNWLPTTAHEFQHLIHDDNDSSEETWLNEGMSEFAEFLCFEMHPMSHVNAFLDYPENSLIEWDEHVDAPTGPETLADYGQAYLFVLYMNDHFGHDFIQALAKNETHGIESTNQVLNQFNTGIDFEELFRRFTIAAAIDTEIFADDIYNFDSIDVNVDFKSALEYDKDGVPAWGADYKVLDNSKRIRNIKFDGVEFMPNPWKAIEDPKENRGTVLWGNNGDNIDNQLIFRADLSNAVNPLLKFDTFVDAEPLWDACMVQVSTDEGKTWSSLANDNTIDKDTFPYNSQAPQIYENLPGFSRQDQAWSTEEFDLTSYVGKEILVAFRYMTDSASNESGWFIDNVQIEEIGYNHDCNSMEGFHSIDEILNIKVDYCVTFINKKTFGNEDDLIQFTLYSIDNLDPFNITEKDSVKLNCLFQHGTTYMIVWYAAPIGKEGAVDFTYEIIYRKSFDGMKTR